MSGDSFREDVAWCTMEDLALFERITDMLLHGHIMRDELGGITSAFRQLAHYRRVFSGYRAASREAPGSDPLLVAEMGAALAAIEGTRQWLSAIADRKPKKHRKPKKEKP